MERRHVQDVLRQEKGNKVQAAKALGISRRALYRLMEKYRVGEPAAAQSVAGAGSETEPS